MTYDEYLLQNSNTYKIKLTAIEIGFLHSLLREYIENESNKDKGIDVAEFTRNKLDKIISKIRSE